MNNNSFHLNSFREYGFTIFPKLNSEWVEKWRTICLNKYLDKDSNSPAVSDILKSRVVLRGLLSEFFDLFFPSLIQGKMLDFLEVLMGPFVGFDSLQAAITPTATKGEKKDVRDWHRDMWGISGWSEFYFPPNAVNVLTYLQTGTEYGALKLIPGSHCGQHYAEPSDTRTDEMTIQMQAGDVIVIHSSLLHSTSGNFSENERIFVSYFYTKCWLPKRENYNDKQIRSVINNAFSSGDRRVARLFKPDSELLVKRAAGAQGKYSEKELWSQWINEERLEREKGTIICQ